MRLSILCLQVLQECLTCSIARSGMKDTHWDNQVSQFCKGTTQILITTDIMARNSHLMQEVGHIPCTCCGQQIVSSLILSL